ncbi:DUF427 domain-containing protein [Jannaschia aquimarina]|uniref:DUF427 domain-containing protein n=1 Tax=Jannaschia aquimarina TaxID=935700 RepID=A0A0D1EKA5_9RHOB|nr:DUF427 domain-containing protein [Jannaschia aquimarina]KIT18014.1 hypothetical protein jaqu_02410 [Jannaschia aquimarina]SNS88569.1 Uncharacterized conserved protein, DUF427 family [Jannaschia aquimarina]
MPNIEITPAKGVWTVRTADGVLVESRAALELHEDGLPPVIYFPRSDVAMALLEKSDTTSRCPHKGDAGYFHYIGQSERIDDVAWSYEAPDKEAAKPIAGYLAFYGSKVTVEQL